jgi:hypothetical protein
VARVNLSKASTPQEAVDAVRQAVASVNRNMSREQMLEGKRAPLVELRHALDEYPDLGRQLENPPLPQWTAIAESWLTSREDVASVIVDAVTNLA